eukprot:3547768-Rhodomonas_salina.1
MRLETCDLCQDQTTHGECVGSYPCELSLGNLASLSVLPLPRIANTRCSPASDTNAHQCGVHARQSEGRDATRVHDIPGSAWKYQKLISVLHAAKWSRRERRIGTCACSSCGRPPSLPADFSSPPVLPSSPSVRLLFFFPPTICTLSPPHLVVVVPDQAASWLPME